MDKQVILRYDSYSTGRYGSHNCEGVTLQFVDDSDCCFYYAIWNVNLKRKRATKSHSRASDYPRNKFSVTRRAKFFYFWHFSCGLPTPSKGLTAFNECMGKLKQLQFQAMVQSGKRLNKDTIEVIATDKSQKEFRQVTEKIPIVTSYKDLPQSPEVSGPQLIRATCRQTHGISKQDNTEIRYYRTDSVSPCIEDWLSEYCDESERLDSEP